MHILGTRSFQSSDLSSKNLGGNKKKINLGEKINPNQAAENKDINHKTKNRNRDNQLNKELVLDKHKEN